MYTVSRRGKTWGVAVANGIIEGSEYAILQEDYSAVQLTNVEVVGKVKSHWDGEPVKQYKTDTSSFSPDYHITYKKPNSFLYVVEADKTGKSDISAQLQKKLAEAEKTGGVVYLPAGLYRLNNSITVPKGVELRGSSSVPVRCQGGCSNGTLILSYYGYKETDNPLITLDGDGAGLNGLRIDYPLNNPVDDSGKYLKTSPAVYSEADNVYVTNCTITLAAIGVELDGCENAFLKKIVGCCIEGMFNLKNCKNGTIAYPHQEKIDNDGQQRKVGQIDTVEPCRPRHDCREEGLDKPLSDWPTSANSLSSMITVSSCIGSPGCAKRGA